MRIASLYYSENMFHLLTAPHGQNKWLEPELEWIIDEEWLVWKHRLEPKASLTTNEFSVRCFHRRDNLQKTILMQSGLSLRTTMNYQLFHSFLQKQYFTQWTARAMLFISFFSGYRDHLYFTPSKKRKTVLLVWMGLWHVLHLSEIHLGRSEQSNGSLASDCTRVSVSI